jgi:hypothetical protein
MIVFERADSRMPAIQQARDGEDEEGGRHVHVAAVAGGQRDRLA